MAGFRNQHQFGGQLGGPVRQNKDFVMFSFEGWRERVPFPIVTSAPPMEIRDGDFSKFIPTGQTATIKVYDPLTSQSCSNPNTNCISGGVYVRQPFPGNAIPKNRQSLVGQNILKYYPAPNFTLQALSQNYVRGDNLGKYRYQQPLAKWDHIFTELERQLPWNMVREVSCVGTLTNKEVVTTQLSDMNQADYDAAFRNPNFYNATVTNPWYGILPNNQPLGASPAIARRELLRRIPQFNGRLQQHQPVGQRVLPRLADPL